VTIYRWLIAALWLIFIGFWIISAFGAKKNLNTRAWGREAGLRLVIIAIILIALRTIFAHGVQHARNYIVSTDPRLGIIGVALCALGVGLAIWARIYLGRNWGLPMSRKERPELVTTGPYAFVRHPIYAGIILAMLGSAVAETIFWLVPLSLVGAYFIYSARLEERLMVQEFPDTYPAYRQRTKMLVPFLL
jgi:protein-S-isoprenylcysteine O-methyltransferase Ste14